MIIEPCKIHQKRFVVMDDDRRYALGHFVVEHYNDQISSIHTLIHDRWRHQGHGREMYDHAERMLNEQGRVLVPSPSLSRYSHKLWQVRAPHLLVFHTLPSHNGGALIKDANLYRKLKFVRKREFWKRGWLFQFRNNYWPLS